MPSATEEVRVTIPVRTPMTAGTPEVLERDELAGQSTNNRGDAVRMMKHIFRD